MKESAHNSEKSRTVGMTPEQTAVWRKYRQKQEAERRFLGALPVSQETQNPQSSTEQDLRDCIAELEAEVRDLSERLAEARADARREFRREVMGLRDANFRLKQRLKKLGVQVPDEEENLYYD